MYKIGKCLVFKGIWCFKIILEKADVKLEETREVQKHFLYDIAKYTWLANHWMGNTHNFLLIFSHSICKCWYSIQKSLKDPCSSNVHFELITFKGLNIFVIFFHEHLWTLIFQHQWHLIRQPILLLILYSWYVNFSNKNVLLQSLQFFSYQFL